MQRMGVVDMGSNSFRLVVYGYEPGEWWKLIDEIREAVRVSAGMAKTGALQPSAMERALHTATLFASFCRATGVEDVKCLATSAIRDATNGPELVERIERETGLRVRVITGEEEARYGYLTMVNTTTVEDGFGIEMGGGSVQLVRIAGRHLDRAASFPLGAVRVSERFMPGERASGKGMRAVHAEVARSLGEARLVQGRQERRALAGIGGTSQPGRRRRSGALAIRRLEVGGLPADARGARRRSGGPAARPASNAAAIPGIKPDRGD